MYCSTFSGVASIVVKVTIFPKTLCGSLALRDWVAHYTNVLLWIQMMYPPGISMYYDVVFCVFDKVLLACHYTWVERVFCHALKLTQYGDENTKGELYEYTV